MSDNITRVKIKRPDLFLHWADKDDLHITVISLDYSRTPGDNYVKAANDNYSPSQYYVETAFRCLGKTATINNLTLIINQDLQLEAEDFSPIQLEPGDYYKYRAIFPLKRGLDVLAASDGKFDLIAIDDANKIHECRGKFPIG